MAEVVMDPSWVKVATLEVDSAIHDVTEDIADDMRHGVPVDTGELHDSIETKFPRPGVGRVEVGTDHWAPTEYGSRPHVIESHGPWPLRNRETGEVFGRIVNHPGTPAQPFMRPAVYRQRSLG